MCGIIGTFNCDKPISRHRLNLSLESIRHRGPDNSGIWESDDGRTVLGHTRLSIIGLDNGKQPISNNTNDCHIVVNGEFYDYENIRKDLKSKGHVFSTDSDSEIALHLYKEYGTEALQHLRGEFAFIIYDESNRYVFAARDRFGIKPLYYTKKQGAIYFASEIKALLELGVDAEWDIEAYHQRISQMPLADRTMFKGIYQIPPGHYLIGTQDNLRILPYWDFDYPTSVDVNNQSTSEDEWIEQFKSLFEESIRLRLRSDVEVGCYLSGGLDSCAVLGMAQRMSSKPIKAFTIAFEDEQYNEADIAQRMAEHAGSEFIPVPVSQKDIADNFLSAIWHSETLFSNGHGIAKYLLSKAVSKAGIRVVYTGEGVDEILAGYPHFRRDLLANNQQVQNLMSNNKVSMGILLPEDGIMPPENIERLLGFVPTWMTAAKGNAEKINRLMHLDFIKAIGKRNPFEYFLSQIDRSKQLNKRDPLNQSMYLWSKVMLPEFSLNFLGDRMEMANSIEGRVPFLDHKLVEFMTKVPVDFKIRGSVEKYLLREAAKNIITPEIYNRQKHPFLSPTVDYDHSDPLNELIQDTLRSDTLAVLPFFDSLKVKNLLDLLPTMSHQNRMIYDPVLMVILSTCMLKDCFNIGENHRDESPLNSKKENIAALSDA
ncbi:MAG: asparagine synthase (glutamine-hydrolyzing) [Methylococcales bacterium]